MPSRPCVPQICLQLSLSTDNFFQYIPDLTLSTSSFTLSFHLSLGLTSGLFPCGAYSSTVFSNDPFLRQELPAHINLLLVIPPMMLGLWFIIPSLFCSWANGWNPERMFFTIAGCWLIDQPTTHGGSAARIRLDRSRAIATHVGALGDMYATFPTP